MSFLPVAKQVITICWCSFHSFACSLENVYQVWSGLQRVIILVLPSRAGIHWEITQSHFFFFLFCFFFPHPFTKLFLFQVASPSQRPPFFFSLWPIKSLVLTALCKGNKNPLTHNCQILVWISVNKESLQVYARITWIPSKPLKNSQRPRGTHRQNQISTDSRNGLCDGW